MDSSNNLFPQLFDIRPTKENGDLDLEKIKRVRKVLDLKGELTLRERKQKEKAEKIHFSRKSVDDVIKESETDIFLIPNFKKPSLKTKEDFKSPEEGSRYQAMDDYFQREYSRSGDYDFSDFYQKKDKTSFLKKPSYISEKTALAPKKISQKLKSIRGSIFYLNLAKGWKASIVLFLIFSFAVFSGVGAMAFLQKGIQVKGKVLGESSEAYKHLELAQSATFNFQYAKSDLEFQSAYQNFLNAESELYNIGETIVKLARYLPVDSPISLGDHLLKAGKNLSLAGQYLNDGLEDISGMKIMEKVGPSPIEFFEKASQNFHSAGLYLKKTESELNEVKISSIPPEFQNSLLDFRAKLPGIIKSLDDFERSAPIILELLGESHSNKYLLLFQNNHEMRATGGFIGTYGIIDINEGRIENIFIDGIYNPDGQLKEKVVPPRPIQKISAAWSMHDANWFADFPTSAEKIAWFYEKAGGPTVDGIIAITPDIIEDLLRMTGPIEMTEYEMVIDENNFRDLIQYEVEVNYDKSLNQPKKVLADLTPKLIEKIFSRDKTNWLNLFNVLHENFRRKNILFYSFNPEVEKFILEKGWGGQILETNKDYLSVINSNVNGYKTDGVIKQRIQHRAEIQDDGSVIDTLTIVRTHFGGETPYDWYNKVNADYLRVYVPKGSQLLDAKGHTREKYFLPMDYSYFLRDPDLEEIAGTLREDGLSGTHIFEESGKTVFGNWVYVSPGETVIVTYKYKLPFKLDISRPVESYSLLVQKQAGSFDVDFKGSFNVLKDWEVIRQTPDNLCFEGFCQISQELNSDKFFGAVFEKIEENR